MSERPLPERELSSASTVFYTPTEEAPPTSPHAVQPTPSNNAAASKSSTTAQPASHDAAQLNALTPEEAAKAAELIQRNYRGYRERRQLAGLGTDAVSRRWADAVSEAQWRNVTRTRPRAEHAKPEPLPNSTLSTDARRANAKNGGHSTFAQQEWKRLLQIARRADNDDTSDSDGESSLTDEQRVVYREKKRAEKKKREEYARTMGLEYFLEMVDEKHRYGSHLRSYHVVWQQADTNENFFYWLDYGDGKDVEVLTCSRDVLERDQVRYLNREDRQKYLVKVDKDGRLRWVKNDQRINTSYEYKDSLEGIIRADDYTTPVFREAVHGKRHPQQDPNSTNAVDHERRKRGSVSSSSSSSSDSVDSIAEGQHYVNNELEQAHGIKKVQYVSAGALLNHLLQKTTKKNTWIFVADTSFRLYIGIKQSGAFQHSSFLHGSRIAAAGLIKVKDGQLRSLSPLSGHYRPPTKNFRAFVHSLNDHKVDMSRVSISKSYAVLLGLEGYMRTKKSMKDGIVHMEHKAEEIFEPEKARLREEKTQDKSESARKEKEHLEKLRTRESAQRRESGAHGLIGRMKLLGRKMRHSEPSTPEENTKSTPVMPKKTTTSASGGTANSTEQETGEMQPTASGGTSTPLQMKRTSSREQNHPSVLEKTDASTQREPRRPPENEAGRSVPQAPAEAKSSNSSSELKA